MAITEEFRRRLAWGQLGGKKRREAIKTARALVAFRVEKAWRREIGLRSAQLKIPPDRVKERYSELREKGIPFMQRGQILAEELEEMYHLAVQTGLIGEKATVATTRNYLENVKKRPLHEILEEMRQHAKMMEQMATRAA